MPTQRVFFNIPPLNDQSTSSTAKVVSGGFSTVAGNENIRFAIGSQDRLLPTDDLYLSGQILHVDSTGTPISVDTAGGINKAHYSLNNTADLTKFANQNISNWGGIQTMVKKIFLQSKKTAINISEHRNYPMYVSARNAWTNNKADYLVSPMIRYSAGGVDAGNTNRHTIFQDNATTGSSGQMNVLTGVNDPAFGHAFSFKLDTALLNNNQPLHLGSDYTGGLIINLELNNANGFYSNRFKEMGTNQAGATPDGSYYIVKNLRLNGRLLVPTPQDLQNYNPNFMLNDRFNLINQINSSTNASKYTPNVSSVRSMVNMFVDNDELNTRSGNQTSFKLPVGTQEYQQNKNNIRQPQDFVVEVVPNLLTKTKRSGAGAVNASLVGNKASMEGDAEVRNLWQRALLNGDLAGKTVCSLEVLKEQLDADYDTAGDADNGQVNLTKANSMGIGLDYTHHAGLVSNYSGSADYDLILKSGVQTGDAVLPASRRSVEETQETYVKNISVFNSQTLVKNM